MRNGELGRIDKENHDNKLQEAKTTPDLVLGDPSRDKGDSQWKSSFIKSAICDSQKLNGVISEFADTDEGRLSNGPE